MQFFKKFKGKRQAATIKLKDWGALTVVILVIAFLSSLLWLLKYADDMGWIDLPDWLYNLAESVGDYAGPLAFIAIGVMLTAFPLTTWLGVSFMLAGVLTMLILLFESPETKAQRKAEIAERNRMLKEQNITIEEPTE